MASSAGPKHVVVIGAGVIGLQTALTLLEAGFRVTTIAELWPGSQDPRYASAKAGAHWRSHAKAGQVELGDWEMQTYGHWIELANKVEEQECGLGLREVLYYWEYSIAEDQREHVLPWSSFVRGFREIPRSRFPPGVEYGVRFDTFAINVDKYCEYLLRQVRALGGETIEAILPTDQGIVGLVSSARAACTEKRRIDAFVNATGLAAKGICGDEDMFPQRGQTVLVRGEAKRIISREGRGENNLRAIIPRPGSGTTIVGVTRVSGRDEMDVDQAELKKLLDGGKELAPELLDSNGAFEVIRVNVGIRPARLGSPRVELEVVDGAEPVVHCYGHAGHGYQSSIGSARKVLRLLLENYESP